MGEFEGKLGSPARWWRWLVGYLPFLTALDFLPRFTFASLWLLVAVFLLYKLIMSFPDEDYYDRDALERQAMQSVKDSKKGK